MQLQTGQCHVDDDSHGANPWPVPRTVVWSTGAHLRGLRDDVCHIPTKRGAPTLLAPEPDWGARKRDLILNHWLTLETSLDSYGLLLEEAPSVSTGWSLQRLDWAGVIFGLGSTLIAMKHAPTIVSPQQLSLTEVWSCSSCRDPLQITPSDTESQNTSRHVSWPYSATQAEQKSVNSKHKKMATNTKKKQVRLARVKTPLLTINPVG